MANVRRNGRLWQVRWKQPDGTQGTAPGFATKAVAEATKREIEDCVASGCAWFPRDARPVANLREIAAAYIHHCARRKAKNTVIGYAMTIEPFLRWLAMKHPTLPPAQLDRPTLLEYFDHLSATPATARGVDLDRHRSVATTTKAISRLHRWWKWAQDNDERWPGAIKPPRQLDLAPPAWAKVRAPTWTEMDACVSAAEGPHRKVAILMRYTGLRVQQVMALRWEDADLERALLTIRPELGKSRAEKVGRVVPISPHLVAEIARWGLREGWLVPSFRNAGPRERTFRARDMGGAWERAGVRDEVWRQRPCHAFRKGFRSGLKKLGGDSEAIEYLLGHRLGEGEEDTYQDADALPLIDAVDLIPLVVHVAIDSRRERMAKRRLKLADGAEVATDIVPEEPGESQTEDEEKMSPVGLEPRLRKRGGIRR